MPFWEGLELQVYRFVDCSGRNVCSVKLRPHPQVLDNALGPFRTWLLHTLKWDQKEARSVVAGPARGAVTGRLGL